MEVKVANCLIKNLNELESVYLTDEEYKKLIAEYGKSKTDLYIEDLNRYMIEHDVSYKSHYLTIGFYLVQESGIAKPAI